MYLDGLTDKCSAVVEGLLAGLNRIRAVSRKGTAVTVNEEDRIPVPHEGVHY